MNGILHDLRYGLRGLRKQPAFTILAIMALALGIGSVTSIFSVIDNVLLNPFPYADAKRVALVYIHDVKESGRGGRSFFSTPEFLDYQEQNLIVTVNRTNLARRLIPADPSVRPLSATRCIRNLRARRLRRREAPRATQRRHRGRSRVPRRRARPPGVGARNAADRAARAGRRAGGGTACGAINRPSRPGGLGHGEKSLARSRSFSKATPRKAYPTRGESHASC
jgi:hypothetical protein